MLGTGWGLSNWLMGQVGRENLQASTLESGSSKPGIGQCMVGNGHVLEMPQSHFIGMSTEAQREEVTSPKSHSWLVTAVLGLHL